MAVSGRLPVESSAGEQREQALKAIGQALEGLRYGTITVTVHDSKVVQLEVTEKKRFTG
jgi:hypothetical protein